MATLLKMYLLVLLIFVCSSIASSSGCNLAQVCISDLTDEDCGPGQIVAPNQSMGGCCPGCVFDTGTGGEGNFFFVILKLSFVRVVGKVLY